MDFSSNRWTGVERRYSLTINDPSHTAAAFLTSANIVQRQQLIWISHVIHCDAKANRSNNSHRNSLILSAKGLQFVNVLQSLINLGTRRMYFSGHVEQRQTVFIFNLLQLYYSFCYCDKKNYHALSAQQHRMKSGDVLRETIMIEFKLKPSPEYKRALDPSNITGIVEQRWTPKKTPR